jgi:hypothetical protein
MNQGWRIRLTLEKVGSQYRGSLLTYRDLPEAHEESANLFMATAREEALAIAQHAAERLGLATFELDDRTGEQPKKT